MGKAYISLVAAVLVLAGCSGSKTVTSETTTTVETAVEVHTVPIPARNDTVTVQADTSTTSVADTVETYSGTTGRTTVQVQVDRRTRRPTRVAVHTAPDTVQVQDVDTVKTVTSTRTEITDEPGFFQKLGLWFQGIGAFVVLAIAAVIFLKVFRKGALWPF